MLSIAMLKGGVDFAAYYARDDYYGGDASTLPEDDLGLDGASSSDASMQTSTDRGRGESRPGNGSGGDADAGARGAEATPDGTLPPPEVTPNPGAARGKGVWFGKGAEALELRGAVDPDTLNRLIQGHLPNGVELGIRGGKTAEKEHVGGWDLTFSAPKSVSILAELTGSREIFRAHHEAVKEAVSWLEDEVAVIRRAGFLGKKTEHTGNLVAALYQHDTSREQDPQLHTHALVMNATEREDGRWRSVYSRPLFEHKMAAGTVYRAALAVRLEALGFETERTHADGRFEISAIPEPVVGLFSTRRQQIESKLAQWEGEGAATSARAALMTRTSKKNADLPQLRAEWNRAAQDLGFDAAATLAAHAPRLQPNEPGTIPHADDALRRAIDRLSEHEAVFTHADLVAAVLAEGIGRIDVANAQAAIHRAGSGRVRDLDAARLGERKAWTTPRALEQERRYESLVIRGRNAVQPAVPQRTLRRALKNSPLNEGQQAAVKLIVSSPDQFVAVLGRPGTGKTFLLPQVKSLLEARGFVAVGMAPNGAAAKELEHVGGLAGARTVASQLARVGKTLGSLRGMEPEARAAVLAPYRRQVWIVDEASQIHNADMRKLVTLASVTGARVALIGDPAQLGSIDAGKPFERLLTTGIRQVELHQILRQRHDSQKTLVLTAIDRDISGAMKLLAPHVQRIDSEEQRHQEMVRQWSLDSSRESTLMITLRNAAKTRLNDLARDWLRSQGLLGAEASAIQLLPVFGSKADRSLAETYQAGDVIRFNKANARLGTEKNSYWSVARIDGKTSSLRLTLQNGERRVSIDPRRFATALRSTEQFRPRNTTLAVHDRLVWNRPDPAKGLVNGDRLVVESIADGVAVLRTDDGRRLTLSPAQGPAQQHWEHAYATSLYKSQGKTANTVLVDAPVRDAHLMDHHAFLVGVSRHKDSVRFFTDDPDELARRVVLNPGDKSSAQEGRSEHRIERLREQLAAVARIFGGKELDRGAASASAQIDLEVRDGPLLGPSGPQKSSMRELANNGSTLKSSQDRALGF